MLEIIVLFLEVVGFSTAIQVEDSCHDALHALRTEHHLKVLASEQFEIELPGISQPGIVYTLGDGPFRPSRTAVLICGQEIIVDP